MSWVSCAALWRKPGLNQGIRKLSRKVGRATNLSGLNEGQIVEYEEVSKKGKTSAEHLRVQR